MESDYAIRRFVVNTSEWTPIESPVDCSSFSLRCDTDTLYERTDPDNPGSEDILKPGVQESVPGNAVRWRSGYALMYVKTATFNNQIVIGKFVR